MTPITGNTYPHRRELYAIGGRWNAQTKVWEVPDAQVDAARALVASRPRSASRSTYARFSSGAEVYTNRKGRCEDAPCCGCCS